jgi:hypothetical protein
MTENPGNPAGVGGQPSEYGAPPVPPAADYPAQPAGYPPPPATEYQQPATEYQQPPADYAQPPAGYAEPQAGYVPPPATPPAAGQQFGSFDPKSLQNFDPKSVNPLDWGIIAAGVLAFLFSFASFYTVKVSLLGFSSGTGSENGWHGFWSPVAILLVIIATLLLAAQLVARIQFPFPLRLVVLAAFGVAFLFLLIALFAYPGNTGPGSLAGAHINKGHGFGYWITFLLVIVGTALSAKRFLDTGGKLPNRR